MASTMATATTGLLCNVSSAGTLHLAFRTLFPGSSIDLRGASFNQLSPGHRHPRPREMLIALCPCLCLTVLCPLASLGVVSTYMQLIDVCRSASQAIPLHASLPLSPAQCRLRSVLSGRL